MCQRDGGIPSLKLGNQVHRGPGGQIMLSVHTYAQTIGEAKTSGQRWFVSERLEEFGGFTPQKVIKPWIPPPAW